MRIRSLALLLLLIGVHSPAELLAGDATPLFTVLSEASPTPGAPALSERVGEIDLAAVREATAIVIHVPFVFQTVERTRFEPRANGGFLWYGRWYGHSEILITSEALSPISASAARTACGSSSH